MVAASVAACPSEADCSPLSSSAAGSRGIGVSCRPGCRKLQNRRLRPGLRAAPQRRIGTWTARLPVSSAHCGLEPGEAAPAAQAVSHGRRLQQAWPNAGSASSDGPLGWTDRMLQARPPCQGTIRCPPATTHRLLCWRPQPRLQLGWAGCRPSSSSFCSYSSSWRPRPHSARRVRDRVALGATYGGKRRRDVRDVPMSGAATRLLSLRGSRGCQTRTFAGTKLKGGWQDWLGQAAQQRTVDATGAPCWHLRSSQHAP